MRFWLLAILLWTGVVYARGVTDLRTYGDSAVSTIYIFTSPSCAHCRDFHQSIFPEILNRFVKTGLAQVQIIDIPGTESALQAVQLMRCLPEEKANEMMNWVYENQNQWMAAWDYKNMFLQYTQTLGMSRQDFEKCLANEALTRSILEQRDLFSMLYRVSGTPTTVLRQGNIVKYYVGADRQTVLQGLNEDIEELKK